MYCQNCGMLKINCICGKYNESKLIEKKLADFNDKKSN